MPRIPGKFGKHPPKFHSKTLSFAKYLRAGAPLPEPSKVYWEYLLKNWPMFLNDQLGCCVISCGGHVRENTSAHTGTEVTITDSQIQAGYEAVGGYVPGDSSTDNGCAITDFLSYWQTTGFTGTKLAGWAQVDQANLDHVKQSTYLFGALDIGIQVPQSAMDQFSAGDNWDVVASDGGIVGGHSIPIMGYGAQGCACITWGKIQYMSWDFFQKYCDEAYGLIDSDWINASSGLAPNTINLATLTGDLNALKAA